MDAGHGIGQAAGGWGLALAGGNVMAFWRSIAAVSALLALGYLRFERERYWRSHSLGAQ
jgi:hypothetical protein